MIDPEDPLNIMVILLGVLAGVFFIGAQFEICVEMPERWFSGVVSGIVLALCLTVLYHRRE